MTIQEAWNVIATLDIELVEQYSAMDCDRWNKAIQTLQDIFVPSKTDAVTVKKKRQRNNNPKTQFEIKTIETDTSCIKYAWEWCKHNLPLTDEKGIFYNVSELYIITSSQKIIDKVNSHFGSNFSFNINGERTFYIYN